MKNMTITNADGSTIEVTAVAGGGFDAHLRNIAGETTATVHITDAGSAMLDAMVNAGV
jgi:hypothetical protein